MEEIGFCVFDELGSPEVVDHGVDGVGKAFEFLALRDRLGEVLQDLSVG